MNQTIIKIILTAIGGFLSSISGALYIPVLMMVFCNLIDYITGLMAAPGREDGYISSYKSIKGIVKKIATWILVVVGAIIDALIAYASAAIGLELHLSFLVATIVAIWIICNELISILENLMDIGIEVPGFLMPIVKNIKQKAEDAVQPDVQKDGD